MTPEEKQIYIAEYQAAQECYLHYDSFRWQSGSLIVAGAFIFWGFVFQSSIPDNGFALAAIAFAVTVLMTIWILFAFHYRQIYLCKIDRIYELEEQLGFLQHRRFSSKTTLDKKYNLSRPKGHHLDLALYVLTSITGAICMTYKTYTLCETVLIFSPIIIILVVIFIVLNNERRLKNDLAKSNAKP